VILKEMDGASSIIDNVRTLRSGRLRISSPLNFAHTPYLYYVRMDGNHPPYQRVLFRQKIKLDWLVTLRQKPAVSARGR
jgi:hypothetical protein